MVSTPRGADAAAARGDARAAGFVLLAAIALGVAMVGALFSVDYVPTTDGPNHVLAGYLSAHLHEPGKGYDAFVELGGPLSSLAFHAVFSTLVRALAWRDALRATLAAGALLWAIGFVSVVRGLRPERAVVGLLGFATAFSWTFYMGLFAYWMTLGLDLLVIGLVLRRRPSRFGDRILLGAAIALAMLGDGFAGLLLVVVLVILRMARPEGRVRELAWLVIASAPGLAVAFYSARATTHFVGGKPQVSALLGATWPGARDRFDILWQCFTGGPWWRGVAPLVGGLGGIASAFWRGRRGQASRDEIAIAIAATLLLGLVVTTPIHLELLRDPSPRFLLLGLALGLALLPVEALARAAHRRLATLAIAAFSVASVGWSWVHHARLALASADVMALLALPIRRAGPRLPIVLAPPEGSVAHVSENDRVGDLFAVEQGGMTPYLFAARPGLHPVVWKRPPRDLFPPFPPADYGALVRKAEGDPAIALRPVHLALLAQRGAAFEDVILWGRAADIAAFEARGYLTDARKGGAAILRFAPCGLTVRVTEPAPASGSLVVEYGWAPLVETAGSKTLDAAVQPGEAGVTVDFPSAPCGFVWVRAYRDVDGSGDPGPGDIVCEGSDQAARVPQRVARDEREVSCRLGPRLP